MTTSDRTGSVFPFAKTGNFAYDLNLTGGSMDDRKVLGRELDQIELAMKELEIAYEQYFMGNDRFLREPIKDREALAKSLRRFANRKIMQTDLRFRYQNLATRFHSYQGYWDRILRMMDEGKFVRQIHRGKLPPPPSVPPLNAGATPDSAPAAAGAPARSNAPPPSDAERLYEQLAQAHRSSNLGESVPSRQQVASFLDKQKEAIRQKFGDRPVEFVVVTEEGKPKIKVRPKG